MTAVAVGQVRRCGTLLYRVERHEGAFDTGLDWRVRWHDARGGCDRLCAESIECDEILSSHPWQNDPDWREGRTYRCAYARGVGRVITAVDGGEDVAELAVPDGVGAAERWTQWGGALTFDATGLWRPVDRDTDEQLRNRFAKHEVEEVARVAELMKPLPRDARSAKTLVPPADVSEPVALSRDEVIDALIANTPAGLNPGAWALAVPRVVSAYAEAMADREGGFPLPADRCALHADVRDLLAGRGSALGVDLRWRHHYNAAIWALRPRSCSGIHERACVPTAEPYAPHQPRKCCECGRSLPMTLAEEAAHDARWGIAPLPRRLEPRPGLRDAELRAARAAWRWAVCMAARARHASPDYIRADTLAWTRDEDTAIDWLRLYRDGQRVTALARLEALRPSDLNAAGWRRVAMSWVDTWRDGAPLDGRTPEEMARQFESEIREPGWYTVPRLYLGGTAASRSLSTPWQGEGDPEVGP